MTRLSYQDQLDEGVFGIDWPCDGCGKTTPAWGRYEGLPSLGEPTGWICGGCIAGAARTVAAAAWAAEQVPATDWAGDLGVYLKIERNRLLDQNRWAIMPDSPLSEASRAEFMAYLTVLNRMTVDCVDPTTWTWPEAPNPGFD